MEYNTRTGFVSPRGHEQPRETASTFQIDDNTDTAAAAREWQARMARLDAELKDPMVTGTRKRVAQAELQSMQRATEFQVAQWKRIDEMRRQRGGQR